jgi:AraC-like DNA-binding protein
LSKTVKPNQLAPPVFPEVFVGGKGTSEWIVARPLSVLARVARSRARGWVGILSANGLTPDDLEDQDRKVNLHDVIGIFEDVAQAIGNDAAILHEFSTLPAGYAYTFDYVGLLAPSLRNGLQNWQRFYPLHSNALVLKYSENNDYGVLECHLPDSSGPAVQATYAFVAWIAGRIELVLDTVAEEIRLEFAAPAPKQSCRFLEKYANRAQFGRTANRILIPAPLLDWQPPWADRGLLKIIENAAELDMQDRLLEVSPLAELTATIGICLKSGNCSMSKVATSMGVSQKDLQRALEREGTCFRNVLEKVRSSIAGHYLIETDLPMKEIAYLLGFSETSALSRAVKRWLGHPPRIIREQGRNRSSGS